MIGLTLCMMVQLVVEPVQLFRFLFLVMMISIRVIKLLGKRLLLLRVNLKVSLLVWR